MRPKFGNMFNETLRGRFRSTDSKEPCGDLEDATVVITRDGKKYGPFDAKGVRREPGLLQTRHLLTVPGEYEAVLTLKKKGSPEVHTIGF